MRIRCSRHLVLAATLQVVLAACGTVQTVDPASTETSVGGTPPSAPTTDAGTVPGTAAEAAVQRAALEAAERQWDATGVADYRFTLTNICYCVPPLTGPIEIVVVDGAVVSMTLGPGADPTWTGSTVPADQAEWVPGTAEELFDTIREAIGQKDFRAVYDEATGFPLEFYSDRIPEAADDEYGFTTAAFEAT